MRDAHGARLAYGDEVVAHIVDQARDPDSGGRMIDNIITNSILPDLSRQVLARMVEGGAMEDVTITLKDGAFDYVFGAPTPAASDAAPKAKAAKPAAAKKKRSKAGEAKEGAEA
ncbi:hypothetical protein [Paracoccus cavernae]